MDLMTEIRNAQIEKGELIIVWLGQAGFIIKESTGRIVVIDPYLSDCCEKVFGFKRLSPKIVRPGELKCDILFSSHEHLDHLDIDAIPLLFSDKDTVMIGAESSVKSCLEMGIGKDKLNALKTGEVIDSGWIKFSGVYADHGELSPEAIGVLIELEGISIYYAGDTSFCPEKIKDTLKCEPDILIAPINGEYGNLDHKEAVLLAEAVNAKTVIPCHFWMFAEHGGNPMLFMKEAEKIRDKCSSLMLCPGELFKYSN